MIVTRPIPPPQKIINDVFVPCPCPRISTARAHFLGRPQGCLGLFLGNIPPFPECPLPDQPLIDGIVRLPQPKRQLPNGFRRWEFVVESEAAMEAACVVHFEEIVSAELASEKVSDESVQGSGDVLSANKVTCEKCVLVVLGSA